MTSKQALNNIQYMLKRTGNLVFYKEEIEAINKDLKTLETLKYCITDKGFMCDTDSDSIHLKIKAEKLKPYCDKDGNQLFPVNIDSDYDLLKEWLENE